MREYLLGALGVGLVYPAIWYQSSPPAHPAQAPSVARQTATEPALEERSSVILGVPPGAPAKSPGASEQNESLREITQQVLEESVPRVERKLELPIVREPEAPAVAAPLMPLPEALPQTIEQMSELQRLALDPQRLAERVQTLEESSANVDQLKAFAEMFIALPPERGSHEVRPSGRSGSPSGRAR